MVQVYCVVRAKKGQSAGDRLQQLFKGPVFRLLQPSLPALREKVELITADLAEPSCGLSAPDQLTLTRQALHVELMSCSLARIAVVSVSPSMRAQGGAVHLALCSTHLV